MYIILVLYILNINSYTTIKYEFPRARKATNGNDDYLLRFKLFSVLIGYAKIILLRLSLHTLLTLYFSFSPLLKTLYI